MNLAYTEIEKPLHRTEILSSVTKAKLFQEATFFVIIFIYLRSKLAMSTQQASYMSKMHGTSLLSTRGKFGPLLLP